MNYFQSQLKIHVELEALNVKTISPDSEHQ